MTQLRKRLRAHPGVLIHDAFPQYWEGLPPPSGYRVRAGDGALSPDRLDEVGRQPHAVRPRAHARAVRRREGDQGHRRPLRGSHQGARGRPARSGPARRAHSADRGLRCARQGGRRDRGAHRPARSAAVLLRRSQAAASRWVAVQSLCGTYPADSPGRQLADRLEGLRARAEPARRTRRTWRQPPRADRAAHHRRGEDPGDARCRAPEFRRVAQKAGLDPVATAEHFAVRRDEIARRQRARAQESIADEPEQGDRGGRSRSGKLDEEAAEVNAELRSLRARKNNIPAPRPGSAETALP